MVSQYTTHKSQASRHTTNLWSWLSSWSYRPRWSSRSLGHKEGEGREIDQVLHGRAIVYASMCWALTSMYVYACMLQVCLCIECYIAVCGTCSTHFMLLHTCLPCLQVHQAVPWVPSCLGTLRVLGLPSLRRHQLVPWVPWILEHRGNQ